MVKFKVLYNLSSLTYWYTCLDNGNTWTTNLPCDKLQISRSTTIKLFSVVLLYLKVSHKTSPCNADEFRSNDSLNSHRELDQISVCSNASTSETTLRCQVSSVIHGYNRQGILLAMSVKDLFRVLKRVLQRQVHQINS
jgi:hypothetical protein